MSDNEKSVNQSSQGNGGSNKLMLIIGILLGIAIISTVAFFILLFRSTTDKNLEKNEGEVKGEVAKQEAQVQMEPSEEATANLEKLAITPGDHVKGDKNAPVTVVIYDDFECPFCGAFEGTNQEVMKYLKSKFPGWEPVMPNLIKDYVNSGKVKIVYRHFPLSGHKNAMPAAEASECAGTQGKFWEMHDKIFVMNGSNSLSIENFKQAARDLKLDMDKYNACMDNHETQSKIAGDMQSGQALEINGTPAAFINKQVESGAVPYSEFKEVVEEELNK